MKARTGLRRLSAGSLEFQSADEPPGICRRACTR